MAQFLTLFTLARFTRPRDLAVSVRLAHLPHSPAAHLVWTVANTTVVSIAVARIVVHESAGRGVLVTTALPATIPPRRALVFPSDVDWGVLAARSIGVTDETGREHALPRRTLSELKRQLRRLVNRPADYTSAGDWLAGASNLAVGAVVLGLGFFMLMWVLATG